MIKKIATIIIILILYGFLRSPVLAETRPIHSIKLSGNLDISNNISVEHKLTVVGEDNIIIKTGISIKLPNNYTLTSVITPIGVTYTTNENGIDVNFNNKPLKKDQVMTIIINYRLDAVSDHYLDKVLYFPPPETGSVFEFENKISSGKYDLIFFNNNDSELKANISTPLIIIWEKREKKPFEVSFTYSPLHDKYPLPIASETIYERIILNQITNSNRGYIDDSKNYFLINSSYQSNLEGRFTISSKKTFNKTSNFKEIQRGGSISDLKKEKEIDLNLNLNEFNFEGLNERKKLDSFRYALLTSSVLNSQNISNRVVYGRAYYPGFENKLHFWVEYMEGDKVVEIDPFMEELFNLDNKRFGARIALGVVTNENINDIENLSSLAFGIISEPKEVEFEFPQHNYSNISVNFSIFDNKYLKIDAVNNDKYLLSIEEISNKDIQEQIKNILILPGQIYSRDLSYFTDKKQEELKYSLKLSTFEAEKYDKTLLVDLDMSRSYLKIVIILFLSSFAIIAILKVLYYLLFQNRYFQIFKKFIKKHKRAVDS